jgi:hypothetical protein
MVHFTRCLFHILPRLIDTGFKGTTMPPISRIRTGIRLNAAPINRFLILIILLVCVFYPAATPVRVLAQIETCTEVSLHYQRRAADYDGWGLHVWGPITQTDITWESPLPPSGEDGFGLVWEVGMQESAKFLNYIVHKDEEKDPGT